MRELTSRPLIIAKGVAFLTIAVVAAGLVFLESPTARTAALLGALVWAACRFYYFLFHVLERHVHPSLRYTGLIALIRAASSQPKGSDPGG
jgi:hypothetical protein